MADFPTHPARPELVEGLPCFFDTDDAAEPICTTCDLPESACACGEYDDSEEGWEE